MLKPLNNYIISKSNKHHHNYTLVFLSLKLIFLVLFNIIALCISTKFIYLAWFIPFSFQLWINEVVLTKRLGTKLNCLQYFKTNPWNKFKLALLISKMRFKLNTRNYRLFCFWAFLIFVNLHYLLGLHKANRILSYDDCFTTSIKRCSNNFQKLFLIGLLSR